MKFVFLIHKSKLSLDNVKNADLNYLMSICDGVEVKNLNIENFETLFNLGFSTEYQDYYIKFF